jgi:peptide/nickel transport system permease protein
VLKLILRRVRSGILLIFAASLLAFVLLIAGAHDVARNKMGVRATQEQVAKQNEEWGLNKPILVQYKNWLGGAIHGDLGDSWMGTETVSKTLSRRIPVTLTLVGFSLALAAIVATVVGVAAAVRGGAVDRLVQGIGLTGFAIPGLIVAFLLIEVFALKLHIIRATGFTRFSESPKDWLRSVAGPIVALALASLAGLAMQIRGAVRDNLNLDYVRTLRSRGLSSRRVLFRHVLRNAAGPAGSIIGPQFIGLLGGSVFVEQITAIPGLGTLAVNSSSTRDVPMVMGIVIVTAIMVVAVNLITDLATAWLNPKVRLS